MYNDMKIANTDFAKALSLEWVRLNEERKEAAQKVFELRTKWQKALEASRVVNTDKTVQAENEAWEAYDEASKWFELISDSIDHIVELMKMYN